MNNVISNHRSVRQYTNQKIDRALLSTLIAEASRASTTGNMQLYSIVATESDEQKQVLAPLHFNQPMITQAPLVLTFCADYNRFTTWCELRQATPGYNNFHSFLTAAIDALLVAQNFCIAAESRGLGICYLGTTTYNAKELIEALHLPHLVIPVTTITVGYPQAQPPQTDRLDTEAILHYEHYTNYTPNLIDKLYAAKEVLVENQKFVTDNQKQTLAQVFTDIRYKKEDNEFFSQKFIETLKEQGFRMDF